VRPAPSDNWTDGRFAGPAAPRTLVTLSETALRASRPRVREEQAPAPCFEASRPLGLFDEFRVPYSLGAFEPAHSLHDCAALRWSWATETPRFVYWLPADPAAHAGEYRLRDTAVFGRVLLDASIREQLDDGWSPLETLDATDGRPVASIWAHADGSVLLPFDPDELIGNLRGERYRTIGGRQSSSRLTGFARRVYYLVRPVVPRRLQIALRRRFARVQARASFPRWPVEPSLHDLQELILGVCARVAGQPLPMLSAWPGDFRWALVLTHDVERRVGYESIHVLRDLELRCGYRSAWNLVPRRDYDVDAELVQELRDGGFEVGVHGLHHDGRDIECLRERLGEIRDWATQWGSTGFRAPALHRDWEVMPQLGFDHDSSVPDTDPYEPMPGGCCSRLPFFVGDMVELPVTLAQDHGLFVILEHDDEAAWLEKARYLRGRGGMSLLITHPDYMLEEARLAAYERFLTEFHDDLTAWRALPADVAAWWRRRAESWLAWEGCAWAVHGPAADEARVDYFPSRP